MERFFCLYSYHYIVGAKHISVHDPVNIRTITGQQNSLYTAYAKTGQPFTMDVMRKIKIKAMTNAGVPLDSATNAVDKAIADLIKSAITPPVKIPWN